ncbi:hypothetical protein FFONT_1296 [Fervidicoccus fontis Kam940]|uniref:Uncharacterized protein n=1 Tax=Fervidicoccus fontis (strain DSM 19380 / JCM 18336 / VKM B-2539 / Kam940) TaxID=1163730 RepID=I0A2S7_FERFK|nr:hypothetical protein FFONT_1296 [Fervidicoccus fontis Kam940]
MLTKIAKSFLEIDITTESSTNYSKDRGLGIFRELLFYLSLVIIFAER